MLPVGAGMLVLSALTALNSAITARIRVSSARFDWLGALLAFATAVCFISVLAVCFFANVNRFYRMLGEEGYIQLTLPATMGQHIAAKLIAAVMTTLVTFLFLAVCSSLMAFPAGASWLIGYAARQVRHGARRRAFAASAGRGHRAGWDGHGLSAHVSPPARSAACSPAPQAGEHPLVLRAAISRADSLHAGGLFRRDADGGSTRFVQPFFALDLLSSPNGEMKAIFGSLVGVSAVEIVIDAVLWLITQTLLTRKLNLP